MSEAEKRRVPVILFFVVPFVLVFGAGAIVWLFTESELFQEPCVYEDRDLGELDFTLDGACVRVAGMAHYQAVVKQETPATLFRQARTAYLFGIFPPYDTSGRAINVLVHSPIAPEDMVSYELMKVEGRLVVPDLQLVPADTEVILGKRSDYFFTDELVVLKAENILPFEMEDTPTE